MMARTTASVRAYVGSRDRNGSTERKTLNDTTSTTYPTPPTARNVSTSAKRHASTRANASVAIEPDIFDSPSVRSVKVIGTSATRRPAWVARQVFSIWKE